MQRPVAVAGAFRAVPARPPLEHGAGDGLVSADDRVLREGDPVVAGDDDDVGQAQGPERGPELPAPAVHLVGGGPGDPEPGRHQAFRLRDGQFRLRGERQLLRDPRLLPPLRVRRPAVRHVHIEIDPGLPERGDQGGEHPGHAVFHLPGHPGMLRGDARGESSLSAGQRSRRTPVPARSGRRGHRAGRPAPGPAAARGAPPTTIDAGRAGPASGAAPHARPSGPAPSSSPASPATAPGCNPAPPRRSAAAASPGPAGR